MIHKLIMLKFAKFQLPTSFEQSDRKFFFFLGGGVVMPSLFMSVRVKTLTASHAEEGEGGKPNAFPYLLRQYLLL